MSLINSILVLLLMSIVDCECSNRSFGIDLDSNTFLMDSKPFRYVSGSIHYMRIPRALWRDRLRKVRAMGLNAVQFYVQWNLHQPKPHLLPNFANELDLNHFIGLAKEQNLYVLLRIGPYICAEVNNGGLPAWLRQLHPEMQLRSSDPKFMGYVEIWWHHLLNKIVKPNLYLNGGNIIMVQLENEYGSFGCDLKYVVQLRQMAQSMLGESVFFYTTDGANAEDVRCGKIPQVFATIDFGINSNASAMFENQRLIEPRGPLVNSEFYTGWLDLWGTEHQKVDKEAVMRSLDAMLALDANVNLYMAHGGTTFGFNNGAENDNSGFRPQITSYDYDAPINEAGDLTDKYFGLKKVIEKYLGSQNLPNVTNRTSKAEYGQVLLRPLGTIFNLRDRLLRLKVSSLRPLSYEQLGLDAGHVLYETRINNVLNDPAQLELNVHDRAHVFVEQEFQGTLVRDKSNIMNLMHVNKGDSLQIVVENMGRTNFGPRINDDPKGVLNQSVLIDNHVLDNWNMSYVNLIKLATNLNKENAHNTPNYYAELNDNEVMRSLIRTRGACSLWQGHFDIELEPKDTFVDMQNWSKGVIFINGFNLGRFWPRMGPQLTLYVPACKLKRGKNTVIVFEQERPNCGIEDAFQLCSVNFRAQPKLDGITPN